MILDLQHKERLKKDLVDCLKDDDEIRKIVVFGSFLASPDPQDMDVAVFQDSKEPYLSLALKYRRQIRPVSRLIPIDIIPLRNDLSPNPFLQEIEQGETVYEH